MYTFEPLPGIPGGINNSGTAVGWSGYTGYAFLRTSSGTVSQWQYPGSWITFAAGINNRDQTVGSYIPQSSVNDYGLLRQSDGTLIQIDYPGSVYGQLMGIDDAGEIVGYFNDGVNNVGYLRDASGNFTILKYTGAVVIIPDSINNNGQIAGHLRTNDNTLHAFLLNRTTNTYTLFDAPSCSDTIPYGINDDGVIAGVCQSGPSRGFIRRPNGTFGQFPYDIHGINNRGQIVGIDQFSLVGFIGTPILPVTMERAVPPANSYGWNKTNVTVTLDAADNGGSGVKQIQFSLGGAQNTGLETVAGATAIVTISAEGTTLLTYYATDDVGNQETPKTLTIMIDKTPPVITGMPASGCTIWPPNHNLVQAASVTARDAVSGLVPGSFTVTGTSNDPANGQVVITDGATSFNVQLGADKDEVYTLTSSSADFAGNAAKVISTCTVPHDLRR